jgi:uncharacterized protein (TIGR03435 family)
METKRSIVGVDHIAYKQSSRPLLALALTALFCGTANIPSVAAEKAVKPQAAAGNTRSFEVASVKRNLPNDPARGHFQLDGGLLRVTDFSLSGYISFAYKLSPYEEPPLTAQLPKWARTESFDIEAHAEGNPSEDEVRLMMQSLLADRFKLLVHTETKELPVFDLLLIKAGKTGPGLRPHSDDPPCANPSVKALPCGVLTAIPSLTRGNLVVGARNVTVEQIAEMLPSMPRAVDRPVVDETGLRGTFDFRMDFTPDRRGPAADPQPEQTETTTFLEALQDQLGLKLKSNKRAMKVLIVDHVEQPSEN